MSLLYVTTLCQPPVYSFFYLLLRINVTLGTVAERSRGTQLVIHPPKIRGKNLYPRLYWDTWQTQLIIVQWKPWKGNENTTARALDATSTTNSVAKIATKIPPVRSIVHCEQKKKNRSNILRNSNIGNSKQRNNFAFIKNIKALWKILNAMIVLLRQRSNNFIKINVEKIWQDFLQRWLFIIYYMMLKIY